MKLIITLQKEVTSEEEAQTLTNAVKIWLAAHPDVTITSQTVKKLEPVDGL